MARISELHYSNAWANTSGVAEFIEIALSPGEIAADFTVAFYQADGSPGVTVNLADPGVIVTYDPDTDETNYVISADVFDILLTDPDGSGANNYEAYALVDVTAGNVVQFLDIGGGTQNIQANGGLADGAISVNVPRPVGPNQTQGSIQFNQPDPTTAVIDTLSPGDTGLVPCFVSGTLIDTPDGPRAVETLRFGDWVNTEDSGPQKLIWCGAKTVAGNGALAPIRIEAGALGNSEPLLVSPQHRMLVSGWMAELFCGEEEVLIPARHLVNDHSIRAVRLETVRYHHFLFDRHHIVRANGALTESFYPGQDALGALDRDARDEVLSLFPCLAGLSKSPKTQAPALARPLAHAREGRSLAAALDA